eukprot:2184098-Pyramimonas_sp.AAC.1
MDQPLFAERYTEINGIQMVGQFAQHQTARDMADDFYRSQAARAPACTWGQPTCKHLVPTYLHEIHAMMQAHMHAAGRPEVPRATETQG